MSRALLLFVCSHDGRYHGRPEWPPSPARLFQALVAGAAKGNALDKDDRDALVWLEQLLPPIIAAPAVRAGNGFRTYVPNNDLDAVGGDPRRVSEIRAPKFIKPLLFDARMPLLYAWQFDQGEEHAERLCEIAERLYQLGRGVDMAWAWGDRIDTVKLEGQLREHGGVLHRPAQRGEGISLACPQAGSLQSLEVRFEKAGRRFTAIKAGNKSQQLFSQAPKPRFATVAYDCPPRRFLFDLRQEAGDSPFQPWPLARISKLVESIRDEAAKKLKHALTDKATTIEQVIIGRAAKEADKAARIRIIPLPSIGSVHVTRSIRRVLVEVPPNCPLPAGDVEWAFSGLDVVDPNTGELKGNLALSEQDRMLVHYGIDDGTRGGYRIWRTVTAAALSERAARRRIDPVRLRGELQAVRHNQIMPFKETKTGPERLQEEARAVAAVMDALRHADILARASTIRVQREPFEGRGERAEAFAHGTRFAKERLWHAEITFSDAVRGPLVIGDGRYLGLGVMAPLKDALRDVVSYGIAPQASIAVADGPALMHAVRRALMSLARDDNARVPRLFSGHEDHGGQAATGRHEHVFLAANDEDGDALIDRLVVAAPWACDRSGDLPTQRDRVLFDRVVSALAEVRAGRLGVVTFARPAELTIGDPLIGPARVWQSRTHYRATRHAGRRKDPAAALIRDVMAECARRGLPRPEVEILQFSAVPNGGGLSAQLRLRFAAAICGPLLLGRHSHRGGGLFAVQ
jgi:CRISPR-associated protein Csb2